MTAGGMTRPAPVTAEPGRVVAEPASWPGGGERGTSWGTPWVAVTILATFAIPADSVIRVIGGMGFPGGLGAMGLFALWAALVAMGIHHPGGHRNPTTAILLLYTVSTLAGYVVTHLGAPDEVVVRGADRALMLNAACAGLILVISQGCNAPRATRVVLDVLLVGGALCCVVALLDAVTGLGVAETLKQALPGFTKNSEYGAVSDRAGVARVSGTALHPIELGVVGVMVLIMSIGRLQTCCGRGRLVRGGLTVLVALAVPLSVSRSALVGIAVAGVTLLVLYRGPQRAGLVVAVAAAAVAMWLALPRVVSAFVSIIASSSYDDSIAARVFDYEPFLRSFGEHPWLGTGVASSRAATLWDILDNQYLGWLLERGAIGVLGPLALMVLPFLLALRLHRRCTDAEHRTYAASLAAAFAVGAVLSGTFDSFSFPMFVLVYCVLVGLLGAVWVSVRRGACGSGGLERTGGTPWNC